MSRRSLPVFIVSLVACVCAQSSLAADTIPFERLAPKGSALIASAKDVNALIRKIDESPIGQFFVAPELAPALKAVREEQRRASVEAFKELGADVEEMPWPGPVGLSLFIAHNEELDAPEVGALLWADYQDRADAAGKVFDAVIKKAEKELGKPFEEVDVAGGKATRIEFPSEDGEPGPQQPQPPRRGRPGPLDALSEFAEVPEALYYFRQSTQFFVASSVPVLEEAIAAAKGQAGPSISDSDDWNGVQSLMGASDVSLVVLPAPLEELVEPMFAGPMASAKVVVSKLFGGIRGFALSGRAEDGVAMVSFGTVIYAPGERTGVLDILSEATPIEPPPSLIGEHAVTFQRMNVRFAKILELIEGVVSSLPDNESDAIQGMLEPFQMGLKQGLSSLGPAVWSITEPLAAGATVQRGLTAMKCSNEKVANALLATMLPQAGMMPRDFKGQVVYSGEGMPVEVGLGGGALLIGTPEAVEQALRAASDPTAKALADDPLYRECAAAVAAGPVCAWGFVDTASMIDATNKTAAAQAAKMGSPEPQPAAEEDDPYAIVMPNSYDDLMDAALEKVDHAMLARYFGPIVWDARSETKGLVMRGQWLRPKPGS